MYIPKFFKAYELVPPEIYKIYGEDSLMFISEEMKETIDAIRVFFTDQSGKDTKVHVNNWFWNGPYKSRGYRDPFTDVVAKFSQHKFGRAIDFTVSGWFADDVRNRIEDFSKHFPHIHRMERDVSWVHIDSHPDYKDKRIYLFNPRPVECAFCYSTGSNSIFIITPSILI
jgi:hypothetical protein